MPAKIKRGDTVVVLAGKDRGKRGAVRRVDTKHGRLVVEGVNIVKKHQRARQAGQQSEIVEREAPIHASNVMLVDPSNNESTTRHLPRAGRRQPRTRRQAQREGHRIMPTHERTPQPRCCLPCANTSSTPT